MRKMALKKTSTGILNYFTKYLSVVSKTFCRHINGLQNVYQISYEIFEIKLTMYQLNIFDF